MRACVALPISTGTVEASRWPLDTALALKLTSGPISPKFGDAKLAKFGGSGASQLRSDDERPRAVIRVTVGAIAIAAVGDTATIFSSSGGPSNRPG